MFRRLFAIAVLLCLLCVGGAVGTLAWADMQAGHRIAQGVTVQGVDVGGLTVAQARARLQKRIADPALQPVVVTLHGKPHSLDAHRAGVRVDVAGAAMQAAAEGRADGFITRGWRELKGGDVDADIAVPVTVRRAEVRRFVDGLGKAADRPATDAGFSVSVESVGITEAKPGRRLAGRDQLTRRIETALRAPGSHRDLSARTEPVQPKVTADQLRSRHPTVVTVSRAGRTIRVFDGGKVVKTYKAAVGEPNHPTPTGQFSVQSMQKDPPWNVPNSEWAGDLAGKTIPGGDPDNPLVARWIGFNGSVGFHGTKEAGSLGQAASHGCVRMDPGDVKDLFTRVNVGTTVFVGG
ncbi:MAG TPA: L,D-transpeptidase family protein [Thermoleophilaceae bacterium]|nr:L,D-transpeptidase family protein [Thermoleophilaceae bacterium]